MLCETAQKLPLDEMIKYRSLCERGEFYDHLMGQSSGVDRAGFKRGMFREVFFGRVNPDYKHATRFRTEFPGIWSILAEIKAGDHTILARALQRYESSLVIGKVCRRIMTEMPDAPLLTIHDSLLTTAPVQDDFRRVLLDEYAAVGLSPTLH